MELFYGTQEVMEKLWRRQPRVTIEVGMASASLYGDHLKRMPLPTAEPEPEVLSDLDVWALRDGVVLRVCGVWGFPDAPTSERIEHGK